MNPTDLQNVEIAFKTLQSVYLYDSRVENTWLMNRRPKGARSALEQVNLSFKTFRNPKPCISRSQVAHSKPTVFNT